MSNEIKLSELNAYYRTKMNIFSKYLQIVWQRFNWFGALHLALLSFYLTQYNKSDMFSSIPIVGICLSFIWLIIGYMDYMTIFKLKNKGKKIDTKIKELLNITTLEKQDNNSLRMWSYIDKKVSQHMLLYFIPLFMCVVWILLVLSRF